LAIAARRAGQAQLATQKFDQSLSTYKRVSGENPALASRIQVAADASRVQSQFGRAESMLKEALRIRLNHIGYDHPEVVSNFEALADMYRDMGRIDDSLKYRSYAQRARNGLKPY
jgi:tetratricopeptide (TPR) repeat protein